MLVHTRDGSLLELNILYIRQGFEKLCGLSDFSCVSKVYIAEICRQNWSQKPLPCSFHRFPFRLQLLMNDTTPHSWPSLDSMCRHFQGPKVSLESWSKKCNYSSIWKTFRYGFQVRMLEPCKLWCLVGSNFCFRCPIQMGRNSWSIL